jgi:PAS domain S-box-containing protein
MPKIAFIAPDRLLFLKGKAIVQSLGLEEKVDMYFTRLKQAVELAKRLQNEEVDVIVTRGGTAKLLSDAAIKIPVVEVVITGQDLAQVFQDAKNITQLANPKVALLAFYNMAQDVEVLTKILSIQLTIYPLNNVEDIPTRIEEVVQAGHDIVVGGKMTVSLARKRGLKTQMIQSGDYSVRAALVEAQQIALGRQLEKENAEKFKALIDYSLEGIISVDRDKIIRVFNPAAERLLNRFAKHMVGQNIDAVLTFLNVDACLNEGQQSIGQVIQLGNAWITVNMAPIVVHRDIIGAVITFQDVTRIQEMEAKIRNEVLVRKFTASYRLDDILGRSQQILEMRRMAREIAKVDTTVLITGESGTGKELFAQGIHNSSLRKDGPFVAVNCAALPPNLLESELFGYVEGAFTGATKKGKAGLFEMAHRGTIFLDEISEMDNYGQSRLLWVLQEKQVMRLGDDKYIPVDVRIIAATNKNLTQLMKEGLFRQDLFYRLKVLLMNLPPLRRRQGDIEFLARHFLEGYNRQYNKNIELTVQAYALLGQHSWPGNVRELAFFLERLVVVAGENTIGEEVINRYLEDREYDTVFVAPTDDEMSPPEAAQIRDALEQARYNIKHAAALLGLARSTLYRKLKGHNIQVKRTFSR